MSQRTSTALYDIMEKYRNPAKLDENIIGSPYYNESFSYGKVFMKKKELEKVFAVRYNAYTDEIEINDGVKIDVLLKNKDITCLIEGEKYSYLAYFKKNNSEDIQIGYLKTVFEGKKIILYIKESKMFKEGKKAKTSLTTSIPPKLVDFKTFYFSKIDETPYNFKPKNKELLTIIIPKYRSKMKDYIKNNHLKFKSKADLVMYFKYYDLLLSKDSILNQ